ncbi:BatD family protein [Vibrio superstes]|uniref:BatD protein n=1 Tax=Vibrio superstes NBRC 103154 TaxID=1219062 RepID=A0A511QV01_9VIBR|nr:BatD family protein [Vibrio superstes]GEM81198.1 hypothetical protein VSU01S_34430 [Vibrio superstes NBRC 103154]
MKRLVTLFLLMLASLQAVAAPQLVFSVDKHNVAPGEQVNLEFLAATNQYFMDSPEFSAPYISNAMVKQEKTSVVSGFSYIDGEKVASQRWSIQVYPNKEGVYLIPSMTVTLSTVDDELQVVKTQLKTDPVAIMVKSPAALKGESGYLVSDKVSIEDDWGLDGAKLAQHFRKGDIVQRRITIKADNTSTFMMPDFAPSAPEGVSVSLMEPQVTSDYLRGNHTTTLVQTVSYSIDKPGQYSLGGEQLTWWNPQQKQAEEWTAKAVNLDAGGIDYHKLLWWVITITGGVFLLWMIRIALTKCWAFILSQKEMLFGAGPSWLNSCYSKADNKSSNTSATRLVEISRDQALVKDSLECQFKQNKEVSKWQRLKLYLSL